MRGYRMGLLLAVLGLLALGGANRPAQASSTTLLVNEVFNSNTSSPPGAQNEYFEIMNISNSQVDLTTYFVYNKNGRDSLAGVPNPVLAPGEIRVIAATQLPGGDIGVGTVFSGINVGLDTSADYVGLANSAPTDTAIDAVNWGTLNPNWFGYTLFNNEFIRDGAVPLPTPDIGKSLQRFPDGRDTNSVTDWAFMLSSPGSASCADPYEPDDSLANAQAFSTANGTQLHRICGVGDQDWFRIVMNASTNYTFVVTPTGASLVATARLTDGGGNTILTGTPVGRGSVITHYRPTTNGDYYVQVTGNSGAEGPAWLYTITLSTTQCPVAFIDAPIGSPFYPFVECLVCRGIVNGYTDPASCPGGTPCFRPGDGVTRAQVAKIVSLAASWSDAIPSTQQTFEDVPASQPFWLWIEQLALHGAISGYTCGGPGEPCLPPNNRPYFRPGNTITRSQIAKVLALAAQIPDPIPSTRQTFEDIRSSYAAWLWIEQLAGRGVISGYTCGGPGEPCVPSGNRPYFRPGGSTTRGQLAKITANTFFPNCTFAAR